MKLTDDIQLPSYVQLSIKSLTNLSTYSRISQETICKDSKENNQFYLRQNDTISSTTLPIQHKRTQRNHSADIKSLLHSQENGTPLNVSYETLDDTTEIKDN